MRSATFDNVTNYTNIFYRTSDDIEVLVKDETARSWIQDKLGTNGTAIIADV